jgi:hypothetical protein
MLHISLLPIKENAAARNYSGSTPVIINEPARFTVTASSIAVIQRFINNSERGK